MRRDTAVRQLRAYLLAHSQTLPELRTDDPFLFPCPHNKCGAHSRL
jgi:hypothetical protein